MMTDRRQLRLSLLFVATTLPMFVLGCTRPTGSLELTSYKDPYFPETYEVELDECAYYAGPGGDYHIVGRATHIPEDNPGGEITQLLHVHLFWQPRPGKTFDNPSSVDATIRYAILTEQGAAIYCGTAFVYPKKHRTGDDITVKIESARLRLESQDGEPPELIGTARLRGKFVADNDPSLTVDLRRELDLRAGSHEP